MEFGDDDHKVKLGTMDIVETSAFISILGGKIAKKREAIKECQKNIETFQGTFRFHRAMKEFYQNDIAHHKKDITEAAKLIELVSKDPAAQIGEQVP